MNEAERYLHDRQNKSADPEHSDVPGPFSGLSRTGATASTRGIGVFSGWWSLDGRIGRQTYILRLLLIFGIMVVAMIILNVLGAIAGGDSSMGRPIAAFVIFSSMPFALPQHTRRLHDLGWSGWWQLLFLIPLFGLFFRIYLWCKEGTPGNNQYGGKVG